MSSNTETVDLIIIGTGSGNSIPDYLSDQKIVIIEKGTFGGTCINVGCIPSKMFVLPADMAVMGEEAARVNVDLRLESTDFESIRDRVFGRIDAIVEGGAEYRSTGSDRIEMIRGTARFVAERTVQVGDRVLTAPRVLIAAGSRPFAPEGVGLESVNYQTSNTIMRLDRLPRRLGIVGGGFIAVEMGHVFSGLGSEVTIFNRSAYLLMTQDPEISQAFTRGFRHRVAMRLGCTGVTFSQDGDVIRADAMGEMFEFDELLVATGRVSNADLLDLENTSIETNSKNRIVVNDRMETSVPGVYAIGDVANPYQLKHVANAEAKVAFWNIAYPGRPRSMDYRAVPFAVFSHPQIAAVGLTEEEALAEGVEYVIGRRDYSSTAYGWAMEDTESFAKVLVSPESGLILGCHVIGPMASALIQPVIQAMQFGQTAQAVAEKVFYIHPALTEVIENALLAAVEAIGDRE